MNASKFYLQYQGFSGTQKQIDKLEKQFSTEQILRMATERGFKN